MKTKRFINLIFMLNLGGLLAACSLQNSTVDPTRDLASQAVPTATTAIGETSTSSGGVLATQEPVVQEPPTPLPESGLPVLGSSDSIPTPELPFIMNRGAPANDRCWFNILIPQGGTGWVQAEHVKLSGDCPSG